MQNLIIASSIIAKLRDKHGVSRREVEQCFENLCGTYVEDDREDHRTDPPTLWFIAPTSRGRLLKVVFILIDGNVHLKTAFEPSQGAISVYEEMGK